MAKRKYPDNPYLAARYEWNERYGSYMRAASAWRTVGLLSMSMAVIGFGYALYQSTQVKLVPYVVEVDKLGAAVLAGFPAQIEYADERVVRSMLGAWVSNFRSITPDATVQKGYIDRTYAMLKQQDPATEKVNNWFRNNSPFDRARTMTVSIEVNNVVALSNQSYQVDWSEIERDRAGKELRTRRFRGIATVTLSPPQDEAVIRLNPIGLYLKDFDWTAQL
ncbi:MAG: conjugal transfer protein TrbF [Zhengella sp.]|jgi:type IV secretion system protein VirB5|uniref:Conjugal transfer protein TrbF n=3 Tax=Hyphomicrobiales TaxID=356 RepID=A0A5D4H629_9HYPH|nr:MULTISPECIES: conjugal transfer protein TrbF [Hyphomicrobiales]KAB2955944.1 MAG: conjugal transfer protein TrbF [Rhizobiaceae bacterium]MCO5135376.1 conjugal transfer protein TrbF [Phyllobacteriaceae bacterium]KKB07162.1 conjugal transfer protein TrbF [Devosia geojensis]MDF1600305.1 conjugal transfer protein TrbF [Mesorhizobium sp. YIM 152430]MVA99977.1 conjugal transfer protein TrbF [Nitratireductor arenosus]